MQHGVHFGGQVKGRGVMALGEAILVCLAEEPLTGYDLAKSFDTSIGFFWRADHQQIYRELKRLRTNGWVADELVVQTSRNLAPLLVQTNSASRGTITHTFYCWSRPTVI